MQAMSEPTHQISDKQRAVLEAAFEMFAQYGIRRTSMEDIARRAGMSRAALYLHYRNKNDIYRSMTRAYFDQVADAVAMALSEGGAPVEALSRAFAAQTGEVMRVFLDSPHAEELMDAKTSTARDVLEAGEDRLAGIYAEWLQREHDRGHIDLSRVGGDAAGFASTMMAALHGQKLPRPSYDGYCRSVETLALAFGQAIMA